VIQSLEELRTGKRETRDQLARSEGGDNANSPRAEAVCNAVLLRCVDRHDSKLPDVVFHVNR
jgi:hypothetical protein